MRAFLLSFFTLGSPFESLHGFLKVYPTAMDSRLLLNSWVSAQAWRALDTFEIVYFILLQPPII